MVTKYVTLGHHLVDRGGHFLRIDSDEQNIVCDESIHTHDNGNIGIGIVGAQYRLDVNGVIGNSSGDLKLQSNIEGNVTLFEDTNVGDGDSGKMFYIHRKAAEGNNYMRFYISATEKGYIHTSCPMTLQAQVDFTINSVTENIIFKVGDNAGVKKFYFKDSTSNDIATIDSDGNAIFEGNIDIKEGIFVDKTGADSFIKFSRSGSGISQIRATTAGLNFTSETGSSVYITLLTNGGSAGNFGIGTETPGLPLDVRSADDNQAFFFDTTAQAQGVGGGIAFGGKYTDAGAEAMAGRIGTKKTNGTSGHIGFDMIFETQDSVGSITQRAIFLSDGKVGIGDITPIDKLHVDGNIRLNGSIANVTNINMSGDLTSDGTLACVDVETSGNIGAGKSSPNFRIDAYINRTSGIVRSARFQTDGNHIDARGLYVIAGEDIESGTNYWFEAYDGDGGVLTGGLRSVAGVFGVFDASDKRLKQNIKDTDVVGKNIISGLKIRDFEWKKNPKHKVTGLIAQEVLEVCPAAVGEPDPETKMYGVSKEVIIPYLIKHNQEQQAEIEALEVRIKALEKFNGY